MWTPVSCSNSGGQYTAGIAEGPGAHGVTRTQRHVPPGLVIMKTSAMKYMYLCGDEEGDVNDDRGSLLDRIHLWLV